ncbi:O-antigen ligase [Paenibacillus shirakamiensis]|uniref:O-antigen ligase n=1 Tax=Paenibacillus shirakamiensis TaxID=1265935 RepID=A0ABS4JJS9_9BACL|nr:O-antigen ligase family protein [Paenibacillus shirakamiensis]MBP2001947.1 O-antigen ligase [Paenibacillus shirakamiensis]
MNPEVLLLLILAVIMLVFAAQCVLQLGLKVDAGFVLGYSVFFDAFGFFFRQFIPGYTLILLVVAPILIVLIAFFQKPTRALDLFSNGGIWLWAAFFAYVMLSFSWASVASAGLSQEMMLIARAVIPGIYTYIVYKKYYRLSWTIVAIFGLIYAVIHLTFGIYPDEYPGRLTLPGDNPIFNARLSLIAVTIALWGRKIPWYVRIPVIGVGLYSALATQSRGPVAAFLIATLSVALLHLWKLYRKAGIQPFKRYLPLGIVVVVLMGTAVALFTGPLQDAVAGSRFTVLFSANQLQGDDNFLGRVDLQMKAIDEFQQHPFFGLGIGGITPPVKSEFPHNILLELGSELGIMGLFLWLLALLYTLWTVRKQGVLLVLLLQTVGCAMISGDFGYNFEYMLLAFVALVFVPKRRKEGGGRREKNSISLNRA